MRARWLAVARGMRMRLLTAAVVFLAAVGARAAPVPRARFSVGGGGVTALAFLPFGRTLAVATARGIVQIWRLEPRDLVATLMNAGSWVGCGRAGIRSSGGFGGAPAEVPRLLTLNGRGRLGVWSADDARSRFWRDGVGTVAAVSADGRWLAAYRGGANLALLDLRHPTGRLRMCSGATAPTTALALSPRGERVAQAVGGAVLVRLSGEDGAGRVVARLHAPQEVRALAWSPDGHWLAAAGGALQIWKAGRYRLAASAPGDQGAVAFTPDGRWLVSGGDDGEVRLLDPASGAEQATLECRGGAITALACSPDSVLLACGTAHGEVEVWDLRNVPR